MGKKKSKEKRTELDKTRTKFRKFKNVLQSCSKVDAQQYLKDHPQIKGPFSKQVTDLCIKYELEL